jgi:transcriptional regulator of acetoin/glycerol metabolism
MPASADQVRAALAASGGNVTLTAKSLGLARQNLYKRLAGLGLNPGQYRATVPAAPTTPRPLRPPRPLKLARSFHLRADLIRALEDACLDLPAVLRERLSPSQVLERFMDDGFAAWLAAKMEPKS